jgi:hypothetical protein
MPNSTNEGPLTLRLDREDLSPLTADVDVGEPAPVRRRLGFQSGVVLGVLFLMLALALFGLLSDRADAPSARRSERRESPRSASEASTDEAWTFAAFPHPDGVCVEVLPEGGPPVGACPLVVPEGDQTAVVAEVVQEGGLRTVLFGAVPRDTVVIRAVLDDLTTVAGRVAAAPPGTDATYSLFALIVPNVVSGDVVAIDAAGHPIGRAGIVAVLRHPEGIGVMDRYGNEVGYLPPDLGSAWLERWSPPGPLLAPNAIRDVASLDLRPILPDVDSWWDQRPDPSAEDAAFQMWWLSYPIGGAVGTTRSDPTSQPVYPLEHSGAQVAMAPDGSWTLVASRGPTPEVGCLQLWAGVRAVFACPLRIHQGSEVAFDVGPLTVGDRPPALAVLGMASPAVDRIRAAIYHEPDVDFGVLPAPEGFPSAAEFFLALLPSDAAGDLVAIDGKDHVIDRQAFGPA